MQQKNIFLYAENCANDLFLFLENANLKKQVDQQQVCDSLAENPVAGNHNDGFGEAVAGSMAVIPLAHSKRGPENYFRTSCNRF